MSSASFLSIQSVFDNGSIISLQCRQEPSGTPEVIHGDHRPMRHFLEAWTASGCPVVEQLEDGSLWMAGDSGEREGA